MIAKNTKQVFDDLVYQKYCDSMMIPIRYRKAYRKQIMNSISFQFFALARAVELLWIAIKAELKASVLGRWINK